MAPKMSHPNNVTTAPMATNETAVTAAQNIFFWKGVGDIEGQLAEETQESKTKRRAVPKIGLRIFTVHPPFG